MVDLMKKFKLPVLLVSRIGLGTLNHTLLTLYYLAQHGIPVAGVVLNDPDARESKTRSKRRALEQLLDHDDFHAKVSIDYVPSLDDWKVAWDFIHFEGFLGARMSMQFTWQGNDSALAAPLVIDLARLAAFSKAQGESGLMKHTAAYFKSPAGVDEQNFVKQLERLEAYVALHRSASDERRARRS